MDNKDIAVVSVNGRTGIFTVDCRYLLVTAESPDGHVLYLHAEGERSIYLKSREENKIEKNMKILYDLPKK